MSEDMVALHVNSYRLLGSLPHVLTFTYTFSCSCNGKLSEELTPCVFIITIKEIEELVSYRGSVCNI